MLCSHVPVRNMLKLMCFCCENFTATSTTCVVMFKLELINYNNTFAKCILAM